MSYQANLTDIQNHYLGEVAGSGHYRGQCAVFVQEVAHAGNTHGWKQGEKVAGNVSISAGTAIATFDPDGQYGNHTDGRSHAAIYVSQNKLGIVVYDQWLGQPVHQRTIRFGSGGRAVNDGDQYYVIE